MKFPERICLMTILKPLKDQGFHLSLENTVLKKPSLFRVNADFVFFYPYCFYHENPPLDGVIISLLSCLKELLFLFCLY